MSRLSILLLVGLLVGSLRHANAQESFVPLQCSQDGAIIFTSDVADVSEFPAAQYQAEITQTIPLEDPYANLYLFFPGSIICLVDAEIDQTDVSIRPQR